MGRHIVNRWLAEVVLPSVDAAAKFHAKCCHSARKPPVFHDAFLLMDGSYSLNRTRVQALKTRFPSWLHIFTSRAAAADGAKRVLLDQRRCEWLTFVRLDADDMLTQEAFKRIEQSASVSKGDVTVHGAGLLDMVTLYDEGKSLQCEHESRRRNFQMSVEEKRLKWKHLLSSLITLLNEFISKGSRSRWRRRCGGLFGPPMRCLAVVGPLLARACHSTLRATAARILSTVCTPSRENRLEPLPRAAPQVHGNHVHLAEVWERRLGTLNKGSPAEAPRHRVHTARPRGEAEISTS